MTTKYIIQDIKTKEVYWSYRAESGFDVGYESVEFFKTKEDAQTAIEKNWEDEFDGRLLQIIEVITE